MKRSWTLCGVGGEVRRLTYDTGAGAATTVSPVFTVSDVCRLLGKSRRQVYRYLRTGRLRPCARILGQWLLSNAEVARLARVRAPTALRRFFWDVPLSSVSVDTHRQFIMGRLLEEGDRPALQWLFRVYRPHQVIQFLKGRGAAVLSRRAWRFWTAQLGVAGAPRVASTWRSRGRAWGGVP